MKTPSETIRDHPFFAGMSAEHRAVLAEGAKTMSFPAGTILFRQGEPAGQFYLIAQGKIALEAHEPGDGTSPVQVLGAGDVLGWSWLFPPFVWHFQARAIEPVEALVMSGGHLLAATERDSHFGHELMKRVALVVIGRLQATRKQLLALQIQAELEG